MNLLKKYWFVLVLIALVFPLSNLIGKEESKEYSMIDETNDLLSQKVAKTFGKKCIDCHSKGAKLPFYANFPIAKEVIEEDIEHGLADFCIKRDLKADEVMSEDILAKLETIVLENSMPPFKYRALHWDKALSKEEKADILAWVKRERTKHYGAKTVDEKFRGDIIQPLPFSTELTLDWEKVALGDRLYHDVRLSGDNTVSCASCHDLAKGGTDQAKVSTGIHGQKGDINSPTTYNSSYNIRQFWDGRASSLAVQAAGPINNPIEMGSSWEQVIPKLTRDLDYRIKFQKIYGGSGITAENITNAIATFEKSLITPNSRFDQYLRGSDDALTEDEKEGYALFKKHGCAQCHYGMALGGGGFEKMGKKKNYFANREIHKADLGLYNLNNDKHDKHKFKVPVLRNVALTYPYFHDASAETLEDAVSIMGEYQLGKKLSNNDVSKIVSFLKTLTGEYKGQKL